jgi:hypothetical protein
LAPGPFVYYPIVRQVAVARKLDVVDSARLMALVAVARSDAFIAIFDAKYAKYFYEFWRPVTAIRNGDIDDNPATDMDPAWLPLAGTPMHPEYPCAHCIMAATVSPRCDPGRSGPRRDFVRYPCVRRASSSTWLLAGAGGRYGDH